MEINRKLPLAFDVVIAVRIIEAENSIKKERKIIKNYENSNFSFVLCKTKLITKRPFKQSCNKINLTTKSFYFFFQSLQILTIFHWKFSSRKFTSFFSWWSYEVTSHLHKKNCIENNFITKISPLRKIISVYFTSRIKIIN